jgi:hypothetical protein
MNENLNFLLLIDEPYRVISILVNDYKEKTVFIIFGLEFIFLGNKISRPKESK